MLCRDRCATVVGASRSGGSISVAGVARACCQVAVDRGVFGCAGTPCRLVACAGEAIVVRFDWPWNNNDVGDGAVSRSGPF